MPTGYTADVQSGKITSFNEFAKQCARAFGACIMQRDDPADAPIKLPTVDPYHEERLVEAKKRLTALNAMSDDEKMLGAEAANVAAHKRNFERQTEKRREKERYQRMLAFAMEWQPPSNDHIAFRDFMVEQLRESIRFDCEGNQYWEKEEVSTQEWFDNEVKLAARSIAYHTEEMQKESDRIANRRRWIEQLFRSLEEPVPREVAA